MNNIQFIKRSNQENLVIFIHGFQGGIETWRYNEKSFFPELLLQDDYVKQHYDIACFSYYSKFIRPYSMEWLKNILDKILCSESSITRKNLDIESISDLLHTVIEIECGSYQRIVFIAHSMGGLVAKTYILKILEDEKINKVDLLISLAVPHQGTGLAGAGKILFGANRQLKDLAPLSSLVDKTTKKWVRYREHLPRVEYFYGKHDMVVNENSAIGIETKKTLGSFFDADHTSIAKPDSINSLIYKAVIKLLKNCLKESLVIMDVKLKAEKFNNENLTKKDVLQKISFIHKLEKISVRFQEEFHENFIGNIDLPLGLTQVNEWKNINQLAPNSNEVFLKDIQISSEALVDLEHVQLNLITLRTWVLEKKYEFIDLASQIDMEIYQQVIKLFKTIDRGFEEVLSSNNWFLYIPSNQSKINNIEHLKRREGEVDSIRLNKLIWEIHFLFINVWDSIIPEFIEIIINQLHKYEEKKF
ncbi:hypothetical protein NST86_28875 [Bacillus sp. FSL L8-0199]|uniref:GPI inositol-deacylase PGAP1-like alpha/beta domain-containing protein n=1 Tax=Bacillus cereus TaxID=1396 RepID=A0A9X0SJB7_BACCE|nr:hypothetical protein [Bacillus cereus]KXY26717.1 hypothetical protein AT268_04370 [Bacillus cereus]